MKIKNWNDFQHYSKRNPPWIKLHKKLFDDPDWFQLDGESAKFLIMLWLIASDDPEGKLPAVNKIAHMARMTEDKVKKHLVKVKNFLVEHDDSIVLDREETETETVEKPLRFDDFWNTLLPTRRHNKIGCEKKWVAHKLDKEADKIISWVNQMKLSKQWKEGYNPSPEVIINQRRWEDNETASVVTHFRGIVK